MSRFLLAPPWTSISASIQPIEPSLGVNVVSFGPPWSMTAVSAPRLIVAIQASPFLRAATVSVACGARRRMFGFSWTRSAFAWAISASVML